MAKSIAVEQTSRYEVYPVRTQHATVKLYRVKLYMVFSDGKTYTFLNSSDWIDNVNLMRESGCSCSTFTHDLIVSPTHHPEIFNEIEENLCV